MYHTQHLIQFTVTYWEPRLCSEADSLSTTPLHANHHLCSAAHRCPAPPRACLDPPRISSPASDRWGWRIPFAGAFVRVYSSLDCPRGHTGTGTISLSRHPVWPGGSRLAPGQTRGRGRGRGSARRSAPCSGGTAWTGALFLPLSYINSFTQSTTTKVSSPIPPRACGGRVRVPAPLGSSVGGTARGRVGHAGVAKRLLSGSGEQDIIRSWP